MHIVFTVFAVTTVCAFWLIGMANYLTIARVAGLRFPGGLYPVRVYQHALGTMRGSRETRLMLIGFGGALLAAACVGSLLVAVRGA